MYFYNKSTNAWLMVGTVGKHVRYREFDSGRSVTNFSVCYGYEPGDGQGRKKGKYMDVDVWKKDDAHDLALYCSCLEPGDIVFCAGTLERDAYQSDKKGEDVFRLRAEFVSVQQFADEAFADEEDAPAPRPEKKKKLPSKYTEIGQYEDPGMVDLGDEYADDLPDFLQ